MNDLHFAPMDAAGARIVAGWQYEAPYDLYSHDVDKVEETVRYYSDPVHHYYTARSAEGELLGFFCFGQEARVPGGNYEGSDVVDVGIGLRPDLTGRGMGHAFIAAVIGFARRQFSPRYLRATVADFNKRSRRAFEKHGFVPIQAFVSTTESPREFVILRMDVRTGVVGRRDA